MSPGALVAIVLGVMLPIDLVIACIVLRAAWEAGPRFPGQAIGEGAVRRDFQSFKYGIYSLGMCVHVAVDEGYMHLLPARLLRIVGAKPVSVPWEEVEFVRRKGAKMAEALIGRQKVIGPAWALGIAEGATESTRE